MVNITRLFGREHRILKIGQAKYVIKSLAFRDWNGWAWTITAFRNGKEVHHWAGKKLHRRR